MILASCLINCSYNIPDALPSKSERLVVRQDGDTSEKMASTATTVKNMAMSTSIMLMPFLLHTERNIGLSCSIECDSCP